MGAMKVFAFLLLSAAAPTVYPDRSLILWATSAQEGLESVDRPAPSPDLVVHMDTPANLRLPALPEGLVFQAAALDAGLVGTVLREMGKRDRVQSRLLSVNVLDREGDTLARPYAIISSAEGLRVLVVGVTPVPPDAPLRGVHTNPSAQAVRSLAQSIFRRVRYNLLVVLLPETLAGAQAFAKELGIADVVIYRRRPEGGAALSTVSAEKGITVALVPASTEGFMRVRVTASHAGERRYRVRSAESY